jgi:uncharacterized protein (TIGR01777 family)
MISKTTVEYTHLMPCDAGFLYRWHTMPRAINRLVPYWESLDIIEHPTGLANDSKVVLKLKNGPISLPWHLKLFDVEEGRSFCDKQVSGPFSHWRHRHEMHPVNENYSLLVENIDFKLPLLGSFGTRFFAASKLKSLFKYRFKVMENDIKRHYRYKEEKAMKILITGASGLVGNALVDYFSSGAHDVYKLVRSEPSSDKEIQWIPSSADQLGYVDLKQLEGFDAVVHLAGENIAGKRWTKTQKDKIYDSRIMATKFLARTLTKLERPPKVFISASAIGFYGDRGEVVVDEMSSNANDFLGQTCIDWERAASGATEKGIRVVNARFGIILDPRGGALAKMLPLFQLGGGGILGNGKQYMSWIALDDVLGAIHHCIMTDSISGPVNFVAPNAVTNKEFTKVLASVLGRPAIFPAPAIALKLVLGEMAEALLLSSTRVKPKVLEETNHEFAFADLESALRHMLGK